MTEMSLKPLPYNVYQLLKNKSLSLIHKPDTLKTESLLLASLALVISRVIVANISAIKARGTNDGEYRYREAIRTDIREVCGWTLGFIVLRQFQNYIGWGLRKGFKIESPDHGDPKLVCLFKSCLNKIKKPAVQSEMNVKKHSTEIPEVQGLKQTLLKLFQKDGIPPVNINQLIIGSHEMKFDQSRINFLYAPLTKLFKKFNVSFTPLQFTKALHTYLPIALGSIPAVYLAGYTLERFTRDHSDQVVDRVSNLLRPSTPNRPASPPASSKPTTPLLQPGMYASPVSPLLSSQHALSMKSTPTFTGQPFKAPNYAYRSNLLFSGSGYS